MSPPDATLLTCNLDLITLTEGKSAEWFRRNIRVKVGMKIRIAWVS